MPHLLTAAEAAMADDALLGGKAAGLAWLVRNGYDVPPWVVLTAEGSRLLLGRDGTDAFAEATLAALPADAAARREALEAVHRRIAALAFPEALRDALHAALAGLPGGAAQAFAVRSSVVGEDAATASFAGQMESFLFQHGPAAVERAVLGCLAGAFSERAVRYRQEKGLPLAGLQAAVVVQVMVAGDVSGVLFTAHPVTGSRRHALLTACYGLGEGVVSGRCDADEWTVARGEGGEGLDATGAVEALVRAKDTQVVWNRDAGDGTHEVPVAEPLRSQPCLADEQVRALAALGFGIADRRGRPQDVEWTLAGGRVYVLQTRPVTALPPPQPPAGPRVVWDNSNIQESYCGVTTPLTFSFASRAYATVYEQTMRVVGLPDAVVVAHRDVLDNLLGLIRGRIYYNINNWYRGLLLLPSFRTNKADMERMMGLRDPVDFVADRQPSLLERVRRLPRMAVTLLRLLRRFRRLDADVAAFARHFAAVYGRVDRGRLHTLEPAELVALSHALQRDLLQRWTTPIVNDFFVMMTNGRVHRAVARLDLDGPELAQNSLLAGEQGLESVAPTRWLLALCDDVRARPALRALFDAVPDARLLDAVQVADPAFHARCRDYLASYGDRCMGELKLETIPPRHDPSFLFACLRNYLTRPDLTAATLAEKERQLRRDAEADVFARVRARLGRRGLRRFRRDLERLRRGIRHREQMRMDRTRMFGLFRDVYLELGRRLAERGRLDDARDVFYLTLDEIDRFAEGRAAGTDLAALCRVRRAEFAGYEAEDLPHHFVTHGPPDLDNDLRYPYAAPAAPAAGDVLYGTGCYPGVVEAPVKLIFSPEDELSLDGQILCTVRTDPGWAPLFPTAGGLLVERGSTLSHSAIVARELGIPAIVGIPGLTHHLRTGDVVRMDGAAGSVVKVEGPR